MFTICYNSLTIHETPLETPKIAVQAITEMVALAALAVFAGPGWVLLGLAAGALLGTACAFYQNRQFKPIIDEQIKPIHDEPTQEIKHPLPMPDALPKEVKEPLRVKILSASKRPPSPPKEFPRPSSPAERRLILQELRDWKVKNMYFASKVKSLLPSKISPQTRLVHDTVIQAVADQIHFGKIDFDGENRNRDLDFVLAEIIKQNKLFSDKSEHAKQILKTLVILFDPDAQASDLINNLGKSSSHPLARTMANALLTAPHWELFLNHSELKPARDLPAALYVEGTTPVYYIPPSLDKGLLKLWIEYLKEHNLRHCWFDHSKNENKALSELAKEYPDTFYYSNVPLDGSLPEIVKQEREQAQKLNASRNSSLDPLCSCDADRLKLMQNLYPKLPEGAEASLSEITFPQVSVRRYCTIGEAAKPAQFYLAIDSEDPKVRIQTFDHFVQKNLRESPGFLKKTVEVSGEIVPQQILRDVKTLGHQVDGITIQGTSSEEALQALFDALCKLTDNDRGQVLRLLSCHNQSVVAEIWNALKKHYQFSGEDDSLILFPRRVDKDSFQVQIRSHKFGRDYQTVVTADYEIGTRIFRAELKIDHRGKFTREDYQAAFTHDFEMVADEPDAILTWRIGTAEEFPQIKKAE